MAHSTLSVISLPDFPQSFFNAIEKQITLVDQVYNHYFPACEWTSPESSRGACNGGHPCADGGTVSALDSQQTFCTKHFLAVSL